MSDEKIPFSVTRADGCGVVGNLLQEHGTCYYIKQCTVKVIQITPRFLMK